MIDIRKATDALADFKDPFSSDKIIKLSTYCSKDIFTGDWIYRGTIGFQNGNTEGEQKFQASSLAELLKKMEAFVQELK